MLSAPSPQPSDPLRDFLRLCLNAPRCPSDLQTVKILAPQQDWPAVIRYAVERYVAPALYSSLKGRGVLPAETEADLRLFYLQAARRNLLQAHALQQLLALFSGQGIDCRLLKGLALAVPVYGDIAARPVRDLDLLLQPGDLQPALTLAGALGYQVYDVPEHAGTDLEFENEIVLYRPPDGMNLDLHWSLIDSPFYQRRLDLAWFWSQALEFELSGMQVRTLAADANLIYLCAHLALHHRGDELLWSNDIAELLYRCGAQFDWRLVLEKASEFQLLLPLQRVLQQQSRDWGAPLPTWLLKELASLPVSQEERRAFNQLSGERSTSGQHFINDIRFLSGWRQRLKYALQLVFPRRAYMLQRYKIAHPWQAPLYYPYRWWLGLRSLFLSRK